MLYLRKHFDTSGKSAALFHHRAICETAHRAGRDHGQLRGIGCAGTENDRPEAPNGLRREHAECQQHAVRISYLRLLFVQLVHHPVNI
jgi:hypothetical protein